MTIGEKIQERARESFDFYLKMKKNPPEWLKAWHSKDAAQAAALCDLLREQYVIEMTIADLKAKIRVHEAGLTRPTISELAGGSNLANGGAE